jgi:hypothetical protein
VRPESLAGTDSGIRAQALSNDGRLVDDFWFDRADRVLPCATPLACGDVERGAHRSAVAEGVRKKRGSLSVHSTKHRG